VTSSCCGCEGHCSLVLLLLAVHQLTQRVRAGLDVLFHVCTKQPVWFKTNLILSQLHVFVDWAAPMRCHLANATGVVILVSLTWTTLLLQRRLFNSMIAKMGIDAHGSEEVRSSHFCQAANSRRPWKSRHHLTPQAAQT
jgi:hypothetical protein